MTIKNVLIKPNGTRVIMGRKAACRGLKDTELLLKDACKLLRRKELDEQDFASLSARLNGALYHLEWALGALGIVLADHD
jgi:hypothetical protein